MDMARQRLSSFPENVLRYSTLRYLQKKLTAQCSLLPAHFSTLQQWESYKAELIRALRVKLPIWDVAIKGPSHTVTTTLLGDNLVLEMIDVFFEDDFFIPVHLYRQRDMKRQQPAVIVCPGYTQAKNASDIIDVCMALAKAGMMALAMEYDTGECANRPDPHTDVNNITAVGQMLGITNVGLRVMSNLAALRYLKERTDVDPGHIGITGLCQGAIVTWFTAAVSQAFAAVAPLCGATTYEAIGLEYCNRQGGWSGISPYVFDLLKVGDVPHVLACVAPRPLWVQNNLIDLHWPLSGFEKVKQFCAQIYQLYNAEDRCRFSLEHAPHAYADPFMSKIVAWFSTMLCRPSGK